MVQFRQRWAAGAVDIAVLYLVVLAGFWLVWAWIGVQLALFLWKDATMGMLLMRIKLRSKNGAAPSLLGRMCHIVPFGAMAIPVAGYMVSGLPAMVLTYLLVSAPFLLKNSRGVWPQHRLGRVVIKGAGSSKAVSASPPRASARPSRDAGRATSRLKRRFSQWKATLRDEVGKVKSQKASVQPQPPVEGEEEASVNERAPEAEAAEAEADRQTDAAQRAQEAAEAEADRQTDAAQRAQEAAQKAREAAQKAREAREVAQTPSENPAAAARQTQKATAWLGNAKRVVAGAVDGAMNGAKQAQQAQARPEAQRVQSAPVEAAQAPKRPEPIEAAQPDQEEPSAPAPDLGVRLGTVPSTGDAPESTASQPSWPY